MTAAKADRWRKVVTRAVEHEGLTFRTNGTGITIDQAMGLVRRVAHKMIKAAAAAEPGDRVILPGLATLRVVKLKPKRAPNGTMVPERLRLRLRATLEAQLLAESAHLVVSRAAQATEYGDGKP